MAAARGDYATAVRLWRRLADEGDPVAQFNVGFNHAQGQGVPRDYAQAAKWYRLAAEQGHAEAQYRLGLYCEDENVKVATEVVTHLYFEKENEAAEWYCKAAMQGHAEAQYRLGLLISADAAGIDPYAEITGEAVEAAKSRAKNADDDATDWFRMAAEQGHSDAQYVLGARYKYRNHAKEDDAKDDYAMAAKWYRKAAVQGHGLARLSLGVMYATGEGVPQDHLQAYMWFDLAASCDSNPKTRAYVVDMRTAAALKMTPEQISEAQRLAREWRPK